jgi:hypothetical protein
MRLRELGCPKKGICRIEGWINAISKYCRGGRRSSMD